VASFLRTLFARTPVPYVSAKASSGLNILARQDASMTRQMQAMGSVGTLFAIVSRLSNATAQVEWKLYRKSTSGADEDRVEVTRHAALDLWNKPNAFMTRQELVETFEQHIELTGEGWLVIARNPRATLPLELWPVRPDRMAPVPDPTEFLTGYLYTGPDGEDVALDRDQVIQLRMPNPLDPYRGMGPVQSILTDIDSSRYTREWNANFFRNGALPGGLIETEGNLSDPEFDALRMRWNESHHGVSNAHRVAILERGMKWVDRRFSQNEMQFVELAQMSRESIREAFGFPKPLLGSVDDVNRANAEAGAVVFARWLIVPRLERIKQALNNDLLPLYGASGQGLEFDYCNPVPEDEEAEAAELTAKANAAKLLRDAGWEPDDVLQTVGLPPMRYRTPAVAAPPPIPALPPASADRMAPSASFYDLARAHRSALPPANGHPR